LHLVSRVSANGENTRFSGQTADASQFRRLHRLLSVLLYYPEIDRVCGGIVEAQGILSRRLQATGVGTLSRALHYCRAAVAIPSLDRRFKFVELSIISYVNNPDAARTRSRSADARDVTRSGVRCYRSCWNRRHNYREG